MTKFCLEINQIFNMEHFAKIVNCFQPLSIFTNTSFYIFDCVLNTPLDNLTGINLFPCSVFGELYSVSKLFRLDLRFSL